MRRVSMGLACLIGGVVAVEAFALGYIIGNDFALVREQTSTDDPATLLQAERDRTRDQLDHFRAKLNRAEANLDRMSTDLASMRDQITEGYVHHRQVVVRANKTAYPLVEPKLMLSVDTLHGGSVLTYFGTQSYVFAVGQRVDFRLKDCECYLLLKESTTEKAVFAFGCERAEPPDPVTKT